MGNDADLSRWIARVGASGDPAALGALFDATAPALLRLALRVTGDPVEAEDVLQETFLAVLRGASTYDPSRPAGAWLATVLSNAASRRRARRRPGPLADGVDVPAGDAVPAADPEAWRRTRAAMEALPPRERSALLLRYEHGLPAARIAELLAVREPSVRSLLARGTQRLRRRLRPAPAIFPLAPWPAAEHVLARVRERVIEGAVGHIAASVAPATAAASLAGGFVVGNKALVAVVAAVVLLAGGGLAWRAASSTGRGDAKTAPPPLEAGSSGSPGAGAREGPRAASLGASPSPRGVHRGTATPAGRYRGVVHDEEGRALAGVRWTLLEAVGGDPSKVAPGVTDEEGRFAFDVPGARGQVTVRFEAAGRVATWGGASQLVWPDRDAELLFQRSQPVRVRVVDRAEGAAIAGAVVRLYDEATPYEEAFRFTLPKDEATTDAGGLTTVHAKAGPGALVVAAQGFAAVVKADLVVGRTGADVTVVMGRGTRIEGRLVDADGRALKRWAVGAYAFPGFAQDLKTDADGRFVLEHMPSADMEPEPVLRYLVRLYVQKGSIPPEVSRPRWFKVTPPAEGETKAVTLVWEETRTLGGRVRRADGSPAADARVTATAWEGSDWMQDVATAAKAGADGSFTMEDVTPGGVLLVAHASGAPGAAHVSETLRVLAKGPVPSVTLVLPRTPEVGKPVVVVVTTGDGRPLEGAQVDAATAFEEAPWRMGGAVRTDAAGTATVTARERVKGYVLVRALGRAPFATPLTDAAVGAGRVEVRLPSGTVRGRVERLDGRPVKTRMSVYAVVGDEQNEQRLYASLEADDDGRFALQGVGEGEYALSAFTATLRPLGGPLTVRAGETDARVVMVDAEESLNLRAEVEIVDPETGKRFESMTLPLEVTAPGAAASEGWKGTVLSQVDGARGLYRSFYPLRPGSYDVVLRKIFGFKEVRIPLTVDAGKPPTTVRLVLDRGERVGGRVVDAKGEPAGDLRIEVVPGAAGATKEDGTYEVTGLEPGDYDVRVRSMYASSETQHVVVRRGERATADFRVVTGGAIGLARRDVVRPAVGMRATAQPLTGGAAATLSFSAADFEKKGPAAPQLVFPRLAPGRWHVEVEWDGRSLASQDVDVTDRKTTEVPLLP